MEADRDPEVERSPERVLARRVQVTLPGWMTARLPTDEVSVPVRGHRGLAQAVSLVVPMVLLVVGGVLAVGGAVAAERPTTEAIGTLATELGAAMVFAGGVFLVVSRVPTVGRVLVLVATAIVGLAAIAAALTFEWDGAALALAMEFGVAAVALLVIDVVLVGLIFPRVEELASGPDRAVVTLRLRGDRSENRSEAPVSGSGPP